MNVVFALGHFISSGLPFLEKCSPVSLSWYCMFQPQYYRDFWLGNRACLCET